MNIPTPPVSRAPRPLKGWHACPPPRIGAKAWIHPDDKAQIVIFEGDATLWRRVPRGWERVTSGPLAHLAKAGPAYIETLA